VSQACGSGSVPAPPQITEWVADKFGAITKAHEKELEGRKRKHEPTHQLELETHDHHLRVLTSPEVTYVGVRKKTEVGFCNLRDLLLLINPDVSRDDWLRVGNFLKQLQHVDGYKLWAEWSKRSASASKKLRYEWEHLGGGSACGLGTLIFLASKDHAEEVSRWRTQTNESNPEEDRTQEAVDYAQVKVWNTHAAFIVCTHSFMWLSADGPPTPVAKDAGISNMMLQYSQLPLKNWLQHPDCNRYDRVSYFPSLTPTPEQLSPKIFNVFTGMGIERADARPGDCTALIDHITTILCDGNQEHADYLLNCMAQMVQTPWKKLYIALVFVSDEGSGKSLVWNHFMGKIFGNNFLAQANHQAILGNFNDSLSGKVLVVAEELCWNGMKGSGILKDLLSSDTLFVNRKHQQSWVETNMLNLVICTNGAHAVPAGMSARRFFVLKPSNRYTGAQSAEARAYFERVSAVDPKAFAHYLYNRDISDFQSRRVPVTEALTEQKYRSMSPLECCLHEWLMRGYILESRMPWEPDSELVMPRSLWYKTAQEEFGSSRNFPKSPEGFWSALKRALKRPDGSCLLQTLNDGRASRRQMRVVQNDQEMAAGCPLIHDRWLQLPPLDVVREFWVQYKCPTETWS
jgi:hypothetical protein